MQDTVRKLFNIGEWCRETERAINTWRAMTMTGERDPVLSAKAAALEELIAFEWRARNLRMRWNDARIASIAGGTADPFLQPDGEALAADLRSLQADLPRHAVKLSSFQTALAELDRHEARIAERNKSAAALTQALDDYSAHHTALHDKPSTQARSIGDWCDETRDAIDTWRAMTEAGERDPVLSDMWQRFLRTSSPSKDAPATFTRGGTKSRIASTAGGAADPFLTTVGEALAADLRTLQANIPRHAVMLSSLQAGIRGTRSPRGADRGTGSSGGADHTSPR